MIKYLRSEPNRRKVREVKGKQSQWMWTIRRLRNGEVQDEMVVGVGGRP